MRLGARHVNRSLAGALALGLTLAACAPASGGGPDLRDRVIRVAMHPYLSYAPVLLASEEGYFRDEGLDVRLVVLGRSEQNLVAMLSGEADVWPGTITPGFLRAIALGGGMKIVGDKGYLAAQGCTYVGIVLRKGLDPATAATTVRRFNHNREGVNSYLAVRMLASRGVQFSALDFVTIPAEAMPGALADNVLDASASAEPYLSQAIRAGALWIRAQDVMPDYQWGVLTFGARLLGDRRDLGNRFLAAYRRGADQANLGKTPHNLEVLSRATGMTLDELRDSCWPTFRADGRIRLQDILEYQQWAHAQGLLDTLATPAQLYDSSFVVASDSLLKLPRR
jgi:NitT/TauT family transport system substrate-binding protein